MIDFEGLIKRYGKREVLTQVSARLRPGKITSLIGPNGAGKSTLLSIISRLIESDSGSVRLLEKNLNTYPSRELAQHLSILRQSNHIETKLKVGDLVALGRFPHSQGRLKQADHMLIDKALDFTHMQAYRDTYLDELSGGERQRAFIAMTIAQDTQYILLDEPLNNLDMRHSVLVMKTLRRLVDELGKTIVIVLHEINFAAQYSDDIIAMKAGRICHHAPVEEVIQAAVLKEIYDMDFHIIQSGNHRICNYFNL